MEGSVFTPRLKVWTFLHLPGIDVDAQYRLQVFGFCFILIFHMKLF